MKIAIFSDCYLDLTGGIITSINSQKEELEKLGHEVVIFSTAYPKTEEELSALAEKKVYVVPSCKYLIRGATPVSRRPKIIEKWLEKNHSELKDFDIFYIHYESGCSIAGVRLGKKYHIPTVQVMHGREDSGEAVLVPFGFRTFVAWALNWFHSWYVKHDINISPDEYLATTIARAKMWTMMVNHANTADFVITPSEHMKKKLQHYGVVRKIAVFPNGLADRSYPKKPEEKVLEDGHELRMVWHSRVSGEKRMLVLLKALKLTSIKYRLDVYGGGPDLKKAKRYVKRHHLNVKLHGTTPFDKVQEAIKNAHLDVLVSYNFDNHPLTLVEAEANGIPVLICDQDMAGLVPKDSFVLAENETAEAIADALDKLMEDKDRIRRMSRVMISRREETKVSNRIGDLVKFFEEIKK